MCVLSKTLWHTLKGCKQGYLAFHRKRLEPRVLPWQQDCRYHSVSCDMYIAGATFEEHCLNISRVIPDWMLCCFDGTTYDIITFLISILKNREYLQNQKRYAKEENAILFYSEKPFKQAAIIFYFIGTWKNLLLCNVSNFYSAFNFRGYPVSYNVSAQWKEEDGHPWTQLWGIFYLSKEPFWASTYF